MRTCEYGPTAEGALSDATTSLRVPVVACRRAEPGCAHKRRRAAHLQQPSLQRCVDAERAAVRGRCGAAPGTGEPQACQHDKCKACTRAGGAESCLLRRTTIVVRMRLQWRALSPAERRRRRWPYIGHLDTPTPSLRLSAYAGGVGPPPRSAAPGYACRLPRRRRSAACAAAAERR